MNLKEDFVQFYLKKVKKLTLTDEEEIDINDIVEKF